MFFRCLRDGKFKSCLQRVVKTDENLLAFFSYSHLTLETPFQRDLTLEAQSCYRLTILTPLARVASQTGAVVCIRTVQDTSPIMQAGRGAASCKHTSA